MRGLRANFAVCLTQIPTGPAAERARDAAQAITKVSKTCPRLIANRLAYVDAIGMGLGATDYDPKSKAAQEVDDLWAWIAKELKLAPSKT